MKRLRLNLNNKKTVMQHWNASGQSHLTYQYVANFQQEVMSTKERQLLHNLNVPFLVRKSAEVFAVIDEDEKILASLYATVEDGDAYIGGLYCLPAYRSQKISNQLLNYALDTLCADPSIDKINCVIRVFENGRRNEGAKRLFSNLGFTLDGEPKRYFITGERDFHLLDTCRSDGTYLAQTLVLSPVARKKRLEQQETYH